MTPDTAHMKRLFLQMAVVNAVLTAIAVGFAVAHFSYGVNWALYAFVGFIAAAFAVQLWFMRGILRAKKGN